MMPHWGPHCDTLKSSVVSLIPLRVLSIEGVLMWVMHNAEQVASTVKKMDSELEAELKKDSSFTDLASLSSTCAKCDALLIQDVPATASSLARLGGFQLSVLSAVVVGLVSFTVVGV